MSVHHTFGLDDDRFLDFLRELESVTKTGRMTDGRRIRPLTWREMGAKTINWAKRKNFYGD